MSLNIQSSKKVEKINFCFENNSLNSDFFVFFNTIFKKVLRSKNKPTMLLIKKRIWNGHIFNKKEQNNMLLPTCLVYFCYMN